MTSSSLLAFLVVGLVGALLGREAGVIGVVGAVLVGLGVGAWFDAAGRRRLRQLAQDVNAWMGKLRVEPLTLSGGHDAQQLASTLNALGAAYVRRGQRVAAADPQLQDLVAALPDPAMLFDRDLLLVAANPQAHELFATGDGVSTATQALGSAALAELVRETVEQPLLHRLEVRLGDRVVEASTTPLAGKVLLLARDRTQEIRTETLRRDFVANASHELKSPVAGIRTLAEALDHLIDRDPGRARDVAGQIQSEADRLAALVSDLLSLRRVDERVAGEARERVDVLAAVRDVLEAKQVLADDAGIAIRLDVLPDQAPVFVDVVAEDLRLVLANLVDNAVKYNRPGGSVTVQVLHAGAEAVIEVADTGIGIPGKDLGRIFERFHRVDEGRSRDAGGTGLGLSIVRHAVERNGGHVSVSSLLGQGTTFRVALPASLPT